MRRGDYRAAWAVSDAALTARSGPPDDPRLPYHLRWVWEGQSPDGRDVLVRCYHGLGDTLQFMRYLPALRARASSVTLEVQPELAPLLAGIGGLDRIVPFDRRHPVPPGPCNVEIMELAHVLRLPPEVVPPLTLPNNPANARIGDAVLGLCAQAGDWDSERSVPLTEMVGAVGSAGIVRLQRATGGFQGWLNQDDTLPTISHTASLIATTELVLTVDTMIAHLAGSLGHLTWVLLKADADWRWMTGRRDSPWYPSLRLYRQASPGDWSEPLAEVARDLAIRRTPSPRAFARAG